MRILGALRYLSRSRIIPPRKRRNNPVVMICWRVGVVVVDMVGVGRFW